MARNHYTEMSTAEVVRVTTSRNELTAAKVPALRELFRLERLPLAETRVEIELRGVPTAVVNALRRVITDELPGRCLQVPPDGFDVEKTTDGFMLPQFCNQRIALLPLRPQIPADIVDNLRLRLDAVNSGTSVLAVYAGDLEVVEGAMPEPLFNPTFKLAFLQPGKRLVINGIRITTGYGRDDGAYIVARRAAYRHLDVPQHSEAETHDIGGVAAEWSGYKVSSLVANPRHHVLTTSLPATSANAAEARAVFVDACANIKGRLRLVGAAIERRSEAPADSAAHPGPLAHSGVQYTVVQLQEGLSEGILRVPGETYTVGELLRRAVYDLVPDIVFVGYLVIAHENRLELTVRHTDDVARVLQDAVRHCLADFDVIQRGISGAR